MRASSQTQASASSILPDAMKMDTPTELPCMMFPASAPIKTPGQYFLPPISSAARARPLDGHTIETIPLAEKKLSMILASNAYASAKPASRGKSDQR